MKTGELLKTPIILALVVHHSNVMSGKKKHLKTSSYMYRFINEADGSENFHLKVILRKQRKVLTVINISKPLRHRIYYPYKFKKARNPTKLNLRDKTCSGHGKAKNNRTKDLLLKQEDKISNAPLRNYC